MKHKEWLGNRNLIEKLLKETGLYTADKSSSKRYAMKLIIWYVYVEIMSVEETITKLWLDYGIELSYSKYYRLKARAILMMEKVLEK